jgi:hypothetical protein
LKLRRRVKIGDAIRDAEMHSQGLNLDGTARVTAAAKAEERAVEEKKFGRGMYLAVAGIVILLLGLGISFIKSNFNHVPLAQIRQQTGADKKPPKDNEPDTWQPPWVYQEGDALLQCVIPVEQVEILSLDIEADPEKNVLALPPQWRRDTTGAWADFIETVTPPLVDTLSERSGKSRYTYDPSSRMLPTLVAQINANGGDFTPEKLMAAPPTEKIYIWRQARERTTSGYLRGAMLCFAESIDEKQFLAEYQKMQTDAKSYARRLAQEISGAAALGTPLTAAQAARRIPPPAPRRLNFTAALSFVPFVNRDLYGGPGSYADAARHGGTALLNPDAAPLPPPDATPETGTAALADPDGCFFAPVLLVRNVALVKNTAKK